jgi:4-oxalocrotonate tautomerase
MHGAQRRVGRWRGSRPAHTEEVVMPFVNVKLLEGVFSPDQKKEMITKVTDAMVAIEGENMRPVTWVVLEEVSSGDWGIGGDALTTATVEGLAAIARAHREVQVARAATGERGSRDC